MDGLRGAGMSSESSRVATLLGELNDTEALEEVFDCQTCVNILVRVNFLPLQMLPALSLIGAYGREVGRAAQVGIL